MLGQGSFSARDKGPDALGSMCIDSPACSQSAGLVAWGLGHRLGLGHLGSSPGAHLLSALSGMWPLASLPRCVSVTLVGRLSSEL